MNNSVRGKRNNSNNYHNSNSRHSSNNYRNSNSSNRYQYHQIKNQRSYKTQLRKNSSKMSRNNNSK